MSAIDVKSPTVGGLYLELSSEARAAVDAVADLARGGFAERADEYDRSATFPAANFDDLGRGGLLAPTVPRESGGLGLGPLCGDAFGLWMMTKEIAKADLSTARCWEGHANSLVLIDALGSPEQRERWFSGVVERGRSGSPGAASLRPESPARRASSGPRWSGWRAAGP